ncbi:hypothetical protein BJ546DRAFT_561137 [Cryomyces antarcticus]
MKDSYEMLNFLHQIVGCTAVLQSVCTHYTSMCLSNFISYATDARLRASSYMLAVTAPLQIPGFVSTFALVTIAVTSFFFRTRYYESLFILHVLLAVIILATLFHHRPYFETRIAVIVVISIGLPVLDKTVRGIKYIYYRRGTSATVSLLPNNAIKVVVDRSLLRSRRDQHAFLWMSGIRKFETLSFTMVSVDPVELVISANKGFTKHLHNFTVQNPEGFTRATLDGPYGNLPCFQKYDRVLLVA